MDEIIVRPKYSRPTGTPRRNRRANGNDMMSTLFAVKMLIVVVFLSVLALCKAANTPATNSFVSKVKTVTTTNYDVNKYLLNAASSMGIKLPERGGKLSGSTQVESAIPEIDSNAEAPVTDKTDSDEGASIAINAAEDSRASDGNDAKSGTGVQVLDDIGIKGIAEKYSFIVPIKGDIVTPFGTHTDSFTGNPGFHSGIDIEANMGTPIKAALAGEVTEVGSKPEYNNYIKIRHNDGITTVYGYCSILIAKKGQKVNQGDVIAKVGDSEDETSSTLHFEVWKDNKAVDPEKLLDILNGKS